MNNLITALANQQMLKRAAEKFADAYRLDPKLAIAESNQGIVLFYLGERSEAQQILVRSATQDPGDAHTWYVLGLLYRSIGKNQEASASFQRVLSIDPTDADAHYFLASSDVELHELNQAIAEYKLALRLNPLEASAEFGLARALQHSGNTADGRMHFAPFEHLMNNKIATPLAHTYGEEGMSNPARMQYELDWNSRFESGKDVQNYRFHYVPRGMQPPDLSRGTVLIPGEIGGGNKEMQ